MFLKNFARLLIIPFFISFNSCCNFSSNKSIFLKIDNLEISHYEYNYEINKLPKEKIDLIKWKKEYIENSFFIGDAYKLKYDTLEYINKKVEITAKSMMVQKYGNLWNATVSPIVDKFMEITDEKIHKRGKLFYFDYIIFKKHDSIISNLNIKSKDDYEKLKANCAKNKDVKIGYCTMQWPFGIIYSYADELYNLKPGDISSIIKLKNDVLVFYLDHIEEVPVSESDKSQLSSILQNIKETEIEETKNHEMILNGKPYIFNDHIKDLILYLKNGNNFMDYKNNPTLISYKINKDSLAIDYNTLKNSLIYSPYIVEIIDSIQLIKEIYQYFYDDYLHNEAYKLGLYSDLKFLLEKRNFKNKLLLNHYCQVHFIDSIKIDSIELSNYYQENFTKFNISQGLNLDILYFARPEIAERYLKELKTNISFSPEKIKGLVDYKKQYIIDEQKNELPIDIVNELEKLPDLTLLNRTVSYNGRYLVVYKRNAVHNYVRSLETVSNEIYNNIFELKFNEKRSKRIEELKKKYPIKINKTGVEI
jgi:hypothetical protein